MDGGQKHTTGQKLASDTTVVSIPTTVMTSDPVYKLDHHSESADMALSATPTDGQPAL